MKRTLISSGSSFEQEIGYSRAVVQGDWIFVSGTTGFDYSTMTIADGVQAQAEQCFKNIESALLQAGSSLEDVVRVTYVLPDGAEFSECWPVLRRYFGEVRPAAMMICASLLDPRMRIEIEVTAFRQKQVARITADDLQAFADAWNRHDIDALMGFMTHDCVFESSAGAQVCGTRYVGRDAVRAGFAAVWEAFPDAHWGSARHFVHGDRGVSEWTFTGTRSDGTRVEVHGCDLFTFRDGKIALKNSYRKNRTGAAA